MTGSVVQYDGFLTSGAAALAPALRYDSPNLSLGTQASWTVFESGNRILQAIGSAAWLSPARERWRVELAGSAGAARYADLPAVGHALARARLHIFADRAGGWLGATTGTSINDSTTQTPFEFAIGGWSVRERTALVGTITTTWIGSDRHVDVAGAARWTTQRVQFEGRLGMRPYAHSAGRVGDALTGGWFELHALIPIARSISLDLSAGSYPADPVRRVLGAKYATAGLRLDFARRQPLPAATIPAAIVARVRESQREAAAPNASIEIIRSGSGHVIRVQAANATSVELMGDFTEWKEVTLTQVSVGVWELQRELTVGVHRLNIRIDGGAWVVPAGARPEEGEFGSAVGVIVVR